MDATLLYDVGAAIYNHATGDHDAAKSNWVDAGLDLVAVAIPYVPAGVSKMVKGAKAVDKAVDAAKTVDRATDTAKTTDKAADGAKTHQTYTKKAKDPSKHGDNSGRTSGKGRPEDNVAKRDKNHHMNDTHGPAKLDKSSTNPDAIRGREQQLIDKKGGAQSQGGTSGNKINGVGANNKKAEQYKRAAEKEFY